MQGLRVFAWNPNGIRSLLNKALPELQRFIAQQRPDILFFPETKGNPKAQQEIERKITQAYRLALEGIPLQFYWSYCEKPGRHGNLCIVAGEAINLVTNVCYNLQNLECHECEGRVIALELANNTTIIGLYVPNAGGNLKRLEYKVNWLQRIKDYVQSLTGHIIVIGDINVAPDERDLCNPKSNLKTPGYTPEERSAFAKLCNETGLRDVWRERNPLPIATQGHQGAYSFWSMRSKARERNAGWRIDLILSSDLEMIGDAYICPQYLGSDHCPIGVQLR